MRFIQGLKNRLIYLIISISFLVACEDKAEIPTDPCQDSSPFTATFQIKEHVGDSLITSDSILFYNQVTFEAPGNYHSYEWKIGQDERIFTTSSVTLQFLEDAIGEIPVRLIATGPANISCYANDNGIDTVQQMLHVIAWKDAPMIGKFKGYFLSDPSDTEQEVEIKYISPEEDISYEPFGGYELINIDKGCIPYPKINNTNLWDFIDRGVKAMKFDAAYTYFYECNAPIAWLTLLGTDTLNVDFTYGQSGTDNRFPDKFIGIRVSD